MDYDFLKIAEQRVHRAIYWRIYNKPVRVGKMIRVDLERLVCIPVEIVMTETRWRLDSCTRGTRLWAWYECVEIRGNE